MVKEKDTIPNTSNNENTDVITPITTKFWETDISDQEFLDLWTFNGIAYRACDQYVGDLTSDKYETSDKIFEDLREELNIDAVFRYSTERAFISGVSFIFLGIPDGKELEEPLEIQMIPDFLQVLPKSWFVLDNENNPELSNIGTYEIMLKGGGTQKIHESRLIKVTLREDMKSSYIPAYRALTTQDNNLWSIGQSMFRGAAGLTHVKISNPKNVKIDGVSMSEVDAVKKNGTFNKVNSETTFISDDRYDLGIHGVQGSRVNIKEAWETTIIDCSVPLKIPWQMLIGAQAGAVTGSETNQKQYFGDINLVRIKYLTNLINCLTNIFGLNKVEIEFETLFEETDVEKAEIFQKAATSAKDLVLTGATPESVIEMINDKFGTELKVSDVVPTESNLEQNKQDSLRFDYKIVISKEFTKEQADEMVLMSNLHTDDYDDMDEDNHIYYQFRDFVPGTVEWSELNQNPNMIIFTAEKSDKPDEEETEEIVETSSFIQMLKNLLGIDAKPFYPKLLPPMQSPWEKEKFMKLESKAANSLIKVFNNSFKFDGMAKALKGSVQFDEKFFNKIKRLIKKDAEAEAFLLIEQEVKAFDTESKLKFSPILIDGITAATEEAKDLVGKEIIVSDRTKAIQRQIQVEAMDKVTKASDDMKGDLRRELEAAITNEDSPALAAKRFKTVVSSSFANTYKNRLKTIAQNEMNRVFNGAAQEAYKDSGIVNFNQWITAGDVRVRPLHQIVHGQVVQVGKKFTIGVIRPPEGVNCRCAVVPYFGEK